MIAVDLQTVTAAGTVVIAVAALGVSVWEGIANRRHDRLSVRPALRIDCTGEKQLPIKITLINSGVGPAIIESFEVDLDRRAVGTSTQHPIDSALKGLGFDPKDYLYFTPWKGEAVSAGEPLPILTFPGTNMSQARADRVRSLLPRIRVRVRYKSIYEESFSLAGGWC